MIAELKRIFSGDPGWRLVVHGCLFVATAVTGISIVQRTLGGQHREIMTEIAALRAEMRTDREYYNTVRDRFLERMRNLERDVQGIRETVNQFHAQVVR